MRSVNSAGLVSQVLALALGARATWEQCGGIGWTGSTACPTAGTVCVAQGPYYSQCTPGTAAPSPPSSTSSSAPTSSAVLAVSSTAGAPSASASATSIKILVGGYSSSISTLVFSPSSKTLSLSSSSSAGSNPSWIALHPTNRSLLFAGQENYSGGILAFSVDSVGKLTQVGSASTSGQSPAYILPINGGTEIFAANYGSGNIQSVQWTSSGFGSSSASLQLVGSGPNKGRQDSPHPHEAIQTQNGGEILVPDLGSDKTWRLTKSGSTWSVAGFIQHPAGSGPRHSVVVGSDIYTVHELSNTLTQHTLPALSSGTQPQLVATLPIIPSGASNTTLAAGELLVSPLSTAFPTQYLYASNRLDPDAGGDTIAIFSLNPLKLVKQVRTGLKTLRGVEIGGPDGKYLIAGGQDSGGIKVFERVSGGADLQQVASVQGVTSPTSFVFL